MRTACKDVASARNQDKNGAKCLLRSTSSGVVRVFDAQGEHSQWPPLTEITILKKLKFIEYPYISLKSLKFDESRIFFIYSIHFSAHFAAPWALLFRENAPFAPRLAKKFPAVLYAWKFTTPFTQENRKYGTK
jgi:hypothetical protein